MIGSAHHDGSMLHVREPEPPELGGSARLLLRVRTGAGVSAVWVRSLRDGEPHFDAARRSGSAAGWDWWEAAMQVANPIQRYRWYLEVPGEQGPGYHWVNGTGVHDRDVPDVNDFRLTIHAPAPEWVRSSVMYQVFPDRFARSAAAAEREVPGWAIACDWDTPVQGTGPQTPVQFYGGDLAGIQERLGHLEDLGATVLYLTPIFPGESNHRYDASSFETVDPMLGGDAALVSLVQAAHARGLRVVGDLTTNHTGSSHRWFRRAHANPTAHESDYYYFNADNTGYEAWLGVPSLPKLNWNSPGLRKEFVLGDDALAVRWLRPPFNLDGWRIDVGNMTGRLGADDLNHEVARLLRARLAEVAPEAMLIAESTSDAAPDTPGDGWQGAVSYTNFTRPIWQWLAADPDPESAARPWFFGLPQAGPNRIDASRFLATHLDFTAQCSWPVRQGNVNTLDTHDTARAATAMLPGGQAVAALIQFTLPGIPLVFAGDEFGLEGHNGEDSRTPMPWDDQQRIVTDLRGHYSALAGLRQEHRALVDGGIRWLHASGDVLAFVREHVEGSVLVVAARAGFAMELPVELVGDLSPDDLSPIYAVGDPPEAGPPEAGAEAVLRLVGSGLGAAVFRLAGISAP